jgi:ABC-2 type transport system ATP-binding protein
MDEAQVLAHRVAVIAKGLIVAEGPPDTIAGRDRMRTTIRLRTPAGAPPLPDWGQERRPDGSVLIRADDATVAVHRMTTWALDHGVPFEVFEVTQPTLEDVYVELTGGEEGVE